MAIAIAGAVVIAGGLALLVYDHATANEKAIPRGGGSSPQPFCAPMSLVPGATLLLVLNATQSCAVGVVTWGANLSFAWLADGGAANFYADWGCTGYDGCTIVLPPTPVYGVTGPGGSFSFNTTATGVEWQGGQLYFDLWASPPDAYTSNLGAGQTVSVLGLIH